jgi:hypothetical protein
MLTSALRDRLRPQTLADIVGNTRATEFLRRMIDAKQREHLIFTGPIGTGKSTLAEAVRRELADPMWSALLKPRFNSSHYSGVDFVRDLLAKSSFVGLRVYVLDEAHALSTQAQTALLSAMEDAASSDLFFFCTTELHKLLPALRRRCRKIFLNLLSPDERTELVLRAWRTASTESPLPADFIAAVQSAELGSPALILNALDNYLAGASAKEAVACELDDAPISTRRQPRITSRVSFDIERAKALRADGKSFEYIARELGSFSAGAVRYALFRDGFHTPRPKGIDIEKAKTLRTANKSFRQIARELRVSPLTVRAAFVQQHIDTSRPRAPLSGLRFDLERAIALNSQGLNLTEIAREVGVSTASIKRAFSIKGVAVRRRFGLRFDLAKAVELRTQGKTFREISAIVGVCGPAIHSALKRRNLLVARGGR